MSRGYLEDLRRENDPLPADSRAFRRELAVASIAFAVGFLVTATTLCWLIWRFAAPEAGWWDILHSAINLIPISVLGGLAMATAAVWIMTRRHYRRGIYRCPYCDRPFKDSKALCDCPAAQALRAPNRSAV